MSKSVKITLLLFFATALFASAQQGQGEKLKVFLDCVNMRCDQNYFRSEINVVDFYRDNLLSDVHVLLTANRNPSGGRNYQMILYGLNSMAGSRDTLKFTPQPNATDFEVRDEILHNLKLGLLPYVIKTDPGRQVTVNMKIAGLEEENRPVEFEDKWDYWVFRLSGNGEYEADANYINVDLSGRATISRVTEKNKFFLMFNTSERARRFKFGSDNEDDEIVVKNFRNSLFNRYVKSISDHWSIGYEGSYNHDTFQNYKSRFTISPAVEYSVFPYQDFNTKFLTFRYSTGLWAANYIDTTLYNRISETRWRQQMEVNADFNQPWGNLGVGARWSNFMDDFSVNNVRLEANIEVRITGGLSFNARIDGSLVHDQINLPRGDASEEDILTQVRQLQTNYDFGTRFGISYRFGSNINNVVNPRFDN